MAKTSNTNELFLTKVRSHCLLLRKDFTFCFNISTGVWCAFSFLFLSRIFLFSWPGEGSMGSSEKSLSNKNFVTSLSPNTFWNIENMWYVMENPKACAENNLSQFMAYLENFSHLALLRQWTVVFYWYDNWHVGGDKCIAINGFNYLLWERKVIGRTRLFCSIQLTYC